MCNIIGLLCSMVGVVLLFYFALPLTAPDAPGVVSPGGSGGPEAVAKRQRWELYANLGFCLVLLGTVLEAVPPVCNAIGCWRWQSASPRATPHPPAEGEATLISDDGVGRG